MPLSKIALAAALFLTPSVAEAVELFCNPIDLCAWLPRDSGGTPLYNHTDPTQPWIIGHSEVVSLAAGEYQMGGGVMGDFKAVFVIENGTLEIKDLPDDWAGFGAYLILCDQATFRVQNAGFRSLAERSFQYPIFAFDDSRIEYTDARFYTLLPALEANGETGHLFQVMGDSSQLVTARSTTPMGVNFPDSNGAWELAATQSSTVSIHDMWTMAELYVQGQASLSVADSFYFDVFFEVCPTDDYSLIDLPELCDLDDPVNGCITAGHQPMSYSTAPPTTPFTLTLTNDRVFSWAVSTYKGSTAHVRNALRMTNLAVGLGGIHDDLQLKLTPGAAPTMEGLTDRTLDFENVNMRGGWMVWPGRTSHIKILPGSEVADILPGDAALVDVEGSVLQGAMFMTTQGTGIRIVDTTVNEGAANAGGKLWAIRSTFERSLSLKGPTWFADTPIPVTFSYDDTASLYEVELTAPTDELETLPQSIPVTGRVRAQTSAGEITPFPTAYLDVYAVSSGASVHLATIDTLKDGVALATWDATAATPGDYEIRLYFVGTDGEQAVSRRRVKILDRCLDVICTAQGACYDVGVCQSSTGACTNPPKTTGAPCDDGDGCTTGDACDGGGACVSGAQAVCLAQGPCFDVGVCETSTGLCTNPAKPTGAACDDGKECTTGEQCDGAGVCAPATDTCEEDPPATTAPMARATGCACSSTSGEHHFLWALLGCLPWAVRSYRRRGLRPTA